MNPFNPTARLLIVDDHPATRARLENSARASSLFSHITTAMHGQEALELLHDRGANVVPLLPDVMLIDLYMPEMNGVELVRELRRHPLFQTILRVIMCGWDGPEERNASHLAGCDLFIKKPGTGMSLVPLLEVVAGLAIGAPRAIASGAMQRP